MRLPPILLLSFVLSNTDATSIRWLSHRPRVLQLEGLLTEEECQHLIELGKPLVDAWKVTIPPMPVSVSFRRGDGSPSPHSFGARFQVPAAQRKGRASSGAFLPLIKRRDPLVQRLEEALAMHGRQLPAL